MVVEKIHPGPLVSFVLPSIVLPLTKPLARNNKMVLSLYYRWALQTLSALAFFHSRKIHLQTFSESSVWLRPDLSVAMTGFINAVIEGEELEDYGEDGGCVSDELFLYDPNAGPSVQEDLWYWATFVWRLMTNGHEVKGMSWDPSCPIDGDEDAAPEIEGSLQESRNETVYQELEEERLGPVFIKAWNDQYASVDEVVKDVLFFAEKAGIDVAGDEVSLGESWDEAFEVATIDHQSRKFELKVRQKI